ncbi:MAG: type I 3-dehydroquinate dehydratase [Luteolibacter sp.]
MRPTEKLLEKGMPRVVGSFGTAESLKKTTLSALSAACDIAEIRLDLLQRDEPGFTSEIWAHLRGFPLLFTARRQEEGGALPLVAAERMSLLEKALPDAALIDIEVASIGEMRPLLDTLRQENLPWIGSFHDFRKLPSLVTLEATAATAKTAGATVFKYAAQLSSPADLAFLAEFQQADHGILVSSMGMGPLAPVSRQLCAQYGSVLNYGFIGETPTAPGQWDSALLKTAISRLASL